MGRKGVHRVRSGPAGDADAGGAAGAPLGPRSVIVARDYLLLRDALCTLGLTDAPRVLKEAYLLHSALWGKGTTIEQLFHEHERLQKEVQQREALCNGLRSVLLLDQARSQRKASVDDAAWRRASGQHLEALLQLEAVNTEMIQRLRGFAETRDIWTDQALGSFADGYRISPPVLARFREVHRKWDVASVLAHLHVVRHRAGLQAWPGSGPVRGWGSASDSPSALKPHADSSSSDSDDILVDDSLARERHARADTLARLAARLRPPRPFGLGAEPASRRAEAFVSAAAAPGGLAAPASSISGAGIGAASGSGSGSSIGGLASVTDMLERGFFNLHAMLGSEGDAGRAESAAAPGASTAITSSSAPGVQGSGTQAGGSCGAASKQAGNDSLLGLPAYDPDKDSPHLWWGDDEPLTEYLDSLD